MRLFAVAVLAATAFAASPALLRETALDKDATNWRIWSPRPEIAPRGYVDRAALALSGNSNSAVFGGWERETGSIQPGAWYRFETAWRAEGLDYPARQVVARLDWTDAAGKRVGQPDYPWAAQASGGTTTVTATVQAPDAATGVKIQLLLVNAPRATVWFDRVSLEPSSAPPPRKVLVAAVNLYPRNTQDPVGEFLALMDRSLPPATDIAVLPEGITVVGTGKTYAEVAEPVPGPVTARLGEFAKKRNTWLVAGVYEREGQAVYNTAVLIDRQGRYAGKYRKVYIPREELEGGITPGSDYPVFDTDFGRIGMMICWDVQYADPARALALRGAELILMPIWGGDETLAKARAMENHVFLASSGYDHPTYLMDPKGELLSVARERGAIASAAIDLNRRYLDSWLGDTRARFMKELRLDTSVDPPGRR